MSEAAIVESKPKKQRKTTALAAANQEIPSGVTALSPLIGGDRAPNYIERVVDRKEHVRKFIASNLNKELRKAEKKAKVAGKQLARWDRDKLEVDYGTVPGQEDKRFLKQPGAEKVSGWLLVRPVYVDVEHDMGNGHLEIVSHARLMAVLPPGVPETEVFSGPDCSCSTMESNYRYQWVKMDPQPSREWVANDGKTQKALGIVKCKYEQKDGQKIFTWFERHDNPNIYNERNKVRQMGQKRALVKAIRNYAGLSEIFVEDPAEWDFPEESIAVEPEEKPSGRVVQSPQTPAGGAVPTTVPTSGAAPKTILLTWTPAKDYALLAGNLAPWLQFIQAELHGAWDDPEKAWKIRDVFVQALYEEARDKEGWTITEFVREAKHGPQVSHKGGEAGSQVSDPTGGNASPSEKARRVTETAPTSHVATQQQRRASPVEGAAPLQSRGPMAPPPAVIPPLDFPTSGKVTRVISTAASKVIGGKRTTESRQVCLNGVWYYCYDSKLWQHLEKAKDGADCEFVIEQRKPPVITGIKRIGTTLFDELGPMRELGDFPEQKSLL